MVMYTNEVETKEKELQINDILSSFNLCEIGWNPLAGQDITEKRIQLRSVLKPVEGLFFPRLPYVLR